MNDGSSSIAPPANLVRFEGPSRYEHVGLLWRPAEHCSTVVIHCHGNFGNFYQNSFIEAFAEGYVRAGISFLSFNFRAHDGISEGYFGDSMEYVGGAIDPINSCIDDLFAATAFCKACGFQRIVLQGHSLGCERVVAFNLKSELEFPFVLLAPVNSKLTQEVWCEKRLSVTLEEQISALKKISGNPLMSGQYGSPSSDENWDYDIPIFKSSLISLLKSQEFRLFDPLESILTKINDCLVVLCVEDHFNFGRYSEHRNFILRLCGRNVSLVEFDAEHDFDGKESEIVTICVNWCTDQ